MLDAQFFKCFVRRLGASGFHILITLLNTFNGFLKVLTIPIQIGS